MCQADWQGFGFSQGEMRLDIQTLCLQSEPPTKREVLGECLAPLPLIIIAEHEYYKRDYNSSLLFFLLHFSRLFQVCIVDFCLEMAKGSLCRIPCVKSGNIPGFLMQGSSLFRKAFGFIQHGARPSQNAHILTEISTF